MTKNVKSKQTTKTVSTEDVLKALQSKHKDGVYMGADLKRKDKVSTGSLILDRALDGGFVKGKIIEIYGPESSGKSTLAFSLLSQIEGLKGFIDAESAYEHETAAMYGVDTSNLFVQRPGYAEEGMEMVLDMVDAGMECVVFDSIAGTATKTELEGDMEDHNVGKKASRMGQFMRKLHLRADEEGCTSLFINQIRDSMSMFSSPITTPGGHALKFHASYRLWIKSTTKIEAGAMGQIGHYMKVFGKKNKFGKPNFEVMVPLIYGYGISPEWEIMELAVEDGIIEKSGSWYAYDTGGGPVKIAQGQYNCFTFLLDNPELTEEIRKKLN